MRPTVVLGTAMAAVFAACAGIEAVRAVRTAPLSPQDAATAWGGEPAPPAGPCYSLRLENCPANSGNCPDNQCNIMNVPIVPAVDPSSGDPVTRPVPVCPISSAYTQRNPGYTTHIYATGYGTEGKDSYSQGDLVCATYDNCDQTEGNCTYQETGDKFVCDSLGTLGIDIRTTESLQGTRCVTNQIGFLPPARRPDFALIARANGVGLRVF